MFKLFRALKLWVILWWRSGRQLWRCPRCRRVRRWSTEHWFDPHPMLVNMHRLPACCCREFPKWAYSSDGP